MPRGQASSKYEYLLDDPDFKRWFLNDKRGSIVTAFDWLRRVGFVHRKYGRTPKQIAAMKPKEATNFILDLISDLDREKKNGGYIANCVKPLKSWLDFNGIQVQQKIKISGRSELVNVADERTPTPEELGKILSVADPKQKVACALVAFAGLRLEVLGNFLGNDGLELIGIIGTNSFGGSAAAGVGFTLTTDSSGKGITYAQYSISGVSSPTSFQATANSAVSWAEDAIVLTPS